MSDCVNQRGFTMEPKNKMDHIEQSKDEAETVKSEGRRKLVQGGMLAVPVLMTLKSTPALAVNVKQPSGFSTSGNLSNPAVVAAADRANGPAYWATAYGNNNKFNGTGNPGVRTDTAFKTVFTSSSDATSLLAVLQSGINTQSVFVAAYLDVMANSFVPGITVAKLLDMWNGTFSPALGITWTRADSENYLRYTMGL